MVTSTSKVPFHFTEHIPMHLAQDSVCQKSVQSDSL